MMKSVAKTGIGLAESAVVGEHRACGGARRSRRRSRKSAPVERPWLTICRIEPSIAVWVKPKMPRTQKPRWETEE